MTKNKFNKLPDNIYKKLTEQIYDGVYFVDNNRKILFWNKQAEKITGYAKKDVLGSHCYNNILQHIDKKGKRLCLSGCPLLRSIKTNKPCANRVYLRRKDGVRIPVDVHTSPIIYQGKTVGAIEVFRDASLYERIERQREKAKNLSLVDVLTSLPNRRYMIKKLRLELNKYKKFKNNLCVAIADVDHFKLINDKYGHAIGDLTLRRIAVLLDNNLRPTDYVGRYGGEEFLILLPNSPQKIGIIALERIRNLVENKIIIKNKARVTISIGAAEVNIKDTPESIFNKADKALYKAKISGRNRIEFA